MWVPGSPIDVVAHARDESGQEHEGLPLWVLFTGDSTHVAVGSAVTLCTGGQGSFFITFCRQNNNDLEYIY